MKSKTKKQLEFSRTRGWGGKRSGAGRPNLSGQVNHMKRPEVGIKTPLHISLKLKKKLPSLRNKKLFKELKKSMRMAKKQGLYVIHFSLQSNHMHLFCETRSNRSLALGMRALAGRFAKHVRTFARINGDASERGSVFNGRYHIRVLRTPKEVKHVLEYVLLNFAKHRQLIEHIDPYSSGSEFQNWRDLLGKRFSALIKWDVEHFESRTPSSYPSSVEWQEILSAPQSWLAKTGWRRAA